MTTVDRGITDYCDKSWTLILSHNGLQEFDDYWNCSGEWVEHANYARGGWSGVIRCCLSLPNGGQAALFVKRQRNYTTWTLRHPILGIPTLAREFNNLAQLTQKGVGTVNPIYFASRNVCGDYRSILITEELRGFHSLMPTGESRFDSEAAFETGRLLRAVHTAGLNHNCYYPKHVFIRPTANERICEARVLDLEKAKPRHLSCLRPLHDLRTMLRRCHWWTRGNRVRFLSGYFGTLDSVLAKRAVTTALHREAKE